MPRPEPKHLALKPGRTDDLLPDLDEPEESQRFSDRLSLKAVAGAAALFLGFVYAYGAVVKAGQLHGADLAVGDTLPLVPLEQILVLGINELLPLGAAATVAFLLGLAFLDNGTPWKGHSDHQSGKEGLSEKARLRIRWGARVLLGLTWLWLFFAGSWTTWFFILMSTATAWYARAEHSTGRSYAIFSGTAIVLFFAAFAYFNPVPLSEVTLTKKDGTVVKGDLIATTGSTWYVGMGNKDWTAIQAREVEQLRVSAVKRDKKESLYHALTGDRLFGWGPE